MLAGFLYLPPLAKLLGQAPLNKIGYLMALLTIPAVLTADVAQKHGRSRTEQADRDLQADSPTLEISRNNWLRGARYLTQEDFWFEELPRLSASSAERSISMD